MVFCPKCDGQDVKQVARGIFHCNNPDCLHYWQFEEEAWKVEAVPAKQSGDFERAKIRSRALGVEILSGIFFGVAVVSFIIALFNAVGGDRSPSAAVITGASFLGAALWLYLTAQIVHIRANTEK